MRDYTFTLLLGILIGWGVPRLFASPLREVWHWVRMRDVVLGRLPVARCRARRSALKRIKPVQMIGPGAGRGLE